MLNARKSHVLDLGAPEEVDEERLEPLELCLGRVREWFPGKCETRLCTAGDFTVFEFLNIKKKSKVKMIYIVHIST